MKTLKRLKSYLILGSVVIGVLLTSCDDNIDPNPTPGEVTVDAGPDQTVDLGQEVTLAGSGSDSNGAEVFYFWEFTQVPDGVFFIIVDDPSDPQSTFTPTVAGVYVLELTGTNEAGNSASDNVTITVEAGDLPVEIGGTIDADRTLENRFEDPDKPDYIASSPVSVQADLTIDPDVKIIFEDGTGLEVTTAGSLSAIGTASEPIVLTGVQEIAGFWPGVNIESNNTSNVFDYVTVEYGGEEGFDGANLKANIMINEAGRLKMTNSISRHSAGSGLYVRSLESTLVDFEANTLTENSEPVTCLFNHFRFFDSNSDYTGNTTDMIMTRVSNKETTIDATWMALNVPYNLPANIEEISSDIVISPGVQIIGQSSSGLEITPTGSLNAVGTITDKIIFKGEQDLPGVWLGLSFHSNNTANELTYVEISNGGADGFDGANLLANIMVDDAGRLKMTNTKSSKSAGYGLYTRTLEATLVDFANNILTANNAPVMTRYNHYHYFDSNSDYSGNTNDYLDSYWSNSGTAQTWTWKTLNVPYRLAANIEEIDSDITIEAGAEFIGQPNSGFEVQAGGSITASGTTNQHIVFRGEQDVVGYWLGLRFLSNDPANSFTYVDISNGGSDGFDGGNRKANVEVGSAGQFTANNCSFTKSGDAGVRIQSGGTFNNSNNSFANNNGVDVDG